MKRILKWWRRRRLHSAQEKYAMCKARRESLEKNVVSFFLFDHERHRLADAAAEEARYMERVEQLMREQS